MSDDIAISVKNVSKAYRIWRDPSARLKAPIVEALQKLKAKSYELLAKILKIKTKSTVESANISKITANSFSPYYKDFYALKDVTFEVKKGEAVGIIGRNGSGKSTLLQMIAGTLTPTSGSIKVNGRVAALLELGSGFNPQFTGRENVYMNAAILGLVSKETEQLFNEIEQFADIGAFIDQPVKTYSSGMLMRLAFAVQAMIKPDILIIDEALSVGDFFFTQKCFSLINKLKASGTTLFFVSHDMGTIRDLCPRAILLNKGQTQFDGENTGAINKYLQNIELLPVDKNVDLSHNALKQKNVEDVSNLALEKKNLKAGKIFNAQILNDAGQINSKIKIGGGLVFNIHFTATLKGRYGICVEIKNRLNQIVTSNSTNTADLTPIALAEGESGCVEIHLTAMFEAGTYTYKAYLFGESSERNRSLIIDETPWQEPFVITWDYENESAPFLGMFGPPVTILIRKLN